MIHWILASVALAQHPSALFVGHSLVFLSALSVAHGLDAVAGTSHSVDYSQLGKGPWVSSNDFSSDWWNPVTDNMGNSAERSLLGRRQLFNCAEMWGKCGGTDFDGPTCCGSDATCKYSNEWYSQCLPSSDVKAMETTTTGSTGGNSNSDGNSNSGGNSGGDSGGNSGGQSEVAAANTGGGTFSGDATYYSDGTIGACSQTVKPDGFRTVALNSPQWDNSNLCGTCIEGSYTENGNQVNFKAIIDNLCPECKFGDLDFRQPAGGPGDGRWPLSWSIIPCPSNGLTVTRENGNKYYSKVKVEGGPSPVSALNCNGIEGKRTSDSFFEFQDNSGTFCAGAECTVSFSSGGSEPLSISGQQLGGFC